MIWLMNVNAGVGNPSASRGIGLFKATHSKAGNIPRKVSARYQNQRSGHVIHIAANISAKNIGVRYRKP